MSASAYTASMERLIHCLSQLPGVGRRSAERMAFYLVKAPPQEAVDLAGAINEMKRSTHHCGVCFNLTDQDPCLICADQRRDQSVVMVVEQPRDVLSIESTGMYKGVYHVLMGRLAPLEGIGPGDLNMQSLVRRVHESHEGSPDKSPICEVVLGTNPTLEGDGTAMYLAEQLRGLGVQVTRLARGLPAGTQLEWLSKSVLADAFAGRQAMEA